MKWLDTFWEYEQNTTMEFIDLTLRKTKNGVESGVSSRYLYGDGVQKVYFSDDPQSLSGIRTKNPARWKNQQPTQILEEDIVVDFLNAVLGEWRTDGDMRAIVRQSVQCIAVETEQGDISDVRPTYFVHMTMSRGLYSGTVNYAYHGYLSDADPFVLRREIEEHLERSTMRRHPPLVNKVKSWVFGSGSAGFLLHELVGHPLETDNLEHGRSWLAARASHTVGPETLTVIDDPCAKGLLGSSRYDDTGRPMRPGSLILHGRVVGALGDQWSGTDSPLTVYSRARRNGFRDPPYPRMTNVILCVGDCAQDRLLAQVQSGVFIRRILSGEVDSISGRFAIWVSDADWIDDGRLQYALQPFLLQGSADDFLGHISAISNDIAFSYAPLYCSKRGQLVPVAFGSPSFVVNREGTS